MLTRVTEYERPINRSPSPRLSGDDASNGYSVTYRKDHSGPMLVALDPMREGLDAERLAFLAQAWKAAYVKAKELRWL